MQQLTLLILVGVAAFSSSADVAPSEPVEPSNAESTLLFYAKNNPDHLEDHDERSYLRNRHNIHDQGRYSPEDRNINDHGIYSQQQKIIDRVYSPDYYEPRVILDYRYLKSGGRDYVRGPGGQIIILPKGIRSDEHKEHDNYDSLIEYLRIKNQGRVNQYDDVSQNVNRRDDEKVSPAYIRRDEPVHGYNRHVDNERGQEIPWY